MESAVKSRLLKFIEHTGLSKNRFEEICGLSKRYVSNISVSIQPDKIERISLKFPSLNTGWLLTGKGRMLNGPYERMNQILEKEGMTQKEFAKGTGGIGFIVPSIYENAQKNIRDSDVLNQWVDYFLKRFPQYSREWILTGDGSMLIQSSASNSLTKKEDKETPLIPSEAFAGYGTVAYGDLPIEDYYTVNEFRDADFLIRVKGDSMSPKFNGGDIVACKKIKEMTFFQWNRIYVIYTESQGILIKRVMPSDDDSSITLVSDNKAYQPFNVPKSEISAIALVLGAITLE